MLRYIAPLILGAVTLTLVGCGGGGSGSSSTSTTPVTVSVSDAPSDDMDEVVVVFNKIALLPISDDTADPIIFDLDTQSVNLLDYQGSDAHALLDNETIATGSYKMCVYVNDGDHPSDPSYVIHTDDGTLPLTVKGNGTCPQGVGSEDYAGVLYFNDTFTINEDNNNFVVEFDLRRGIKAGSDDDYTIQRTSVSLINTTETGSIAGEIDSNTYSSCETDTDSTNGHTHAVYLYSGDISLEEMGPFAETSGTAPVASANVIETDGTYQYDFGYLEPGTYSLGYTCTANDDSEDGLIDDEDFSIYQAESAVVVVAETETTVNL